MSTNSDSKVPNLTGKTSNLKRHLQRFYYKIYEVVIKKDSTIATLAKSQKSYIAKKWYHSQISLKVVKLLLT